MHLKTFQDDTDLLKYIPSYDICNGDISLNEGFIQSENFPNLISNKTCLTKINNNDINSKKILSLYAINAELSPSFFGV